MFLPGDRYLLFNVNAGNYDGQLLIDSNSGEYKTLPKDTRVYPVMNTDTYENFEVMGGGIEIVAEN